MPVVRAWATPVSRNVLKVTVHNTSALTEGGCAVIFSIRSTQPSYFTFVESFLPDDVLLPGEQRSFSFLLSATCHTEDVRRGDGFCTCSGLQPTMKKTSPAKSSFCSSSSDDAEKKNKSFVSPDPAASAAGGGRVCKYCLCSKPPHDDGDLSKQTKTALLEKERACLNDKCTLNMRKEPDTVSKGVEHVKKIGSHSSSCSSSLTAKKRDSSPSLDPFHLNGLNEEKLSPPTVSCCSRNDSGNINDSPLKMLINKTSDKNKSNDDILFLADNTSNVDTSACTVFNSYFLVYYGMIGEKQNCIDAAIKWMKREQFKYMLWRKKVLRLQQKGCEIDSFSIPVLAEPARWTKGINFNANCTFIQRFFHKPYSQSSSKMFNKGHYGTGCLLLPCAFYCTKSLLNKEPPNVNADNMSRSRLQTEEFCTTNSACTSCSTLANVNLQSKATTINALGNSCPASVIINSNNNNNNNSSLFLSPLSREESKCYGSGDSLSNISQRPSCTKSSLSCVRSSHMPKREFLRADVNKKGKLRHVIQNAFGSIKQHVGRNSSRANMFTSSTSCSSGGCGLSRENSYEEDKAQKRHLKNINNKLSPENFGSHDGLSSTEDFSRNSTLSTIAATEKPKSSSGCFLLSSFGEEDSLRQRQRQEKENEEEKSSLPNVFLRYPKKLNIFNNLRPRHLFVKKNKYISSSSSPNLLSPTRNNTLLRTGSLTTAVYNHDLTVKTSISFATRLIATLPSLFINVFLFALDTFAFDVRCWFGLIEKIVCVLYGSCVILLVVLSLHILMQTFNFGENDCVMLNTIDPIFSV